MRKSISNQSKVTKKMRSDSKFSDLLEQEERSRSTKRDAWDEHEGEFELESADMFGSEEVVSLDEFESISSEFDPIEADLNPERRSRNRRKGAAPENGGRRSSDRRKKAPRRRQIDPTTCERDYSPEEVEFMNALDEYKRTSGRMFPTCSEILEVIKSIGYVKMNSAASQSAPSESNPEENSVEDTVIIGNTTVETVSHTTAAFDDMEQPQLSNSPIFTDEIDEQSEMLEIEVDDEFEQSRRSRRLAKNDSTQIFHSEHETTFPEAAIFAGELRIESDSAVFSL